MEGFAYAYPPFPQMRPPEMEYPDHGDGFREYYGLDPVDTDREVKRLFIFLYIHNIVII